jgi:hypothetical protein
MTKREIKAAAKARKAASARMRGADRKAHFAAGGDLASWRGRHTVFQDRKREASRRRCRGSFKGEV